jgi:DNA-binding LacI/PurR family transcriptional regulator
MDKRFSTIQLDHSSAFPLANQLARKLTWMIAAGDITEGETLPNIRDFSETLGIHMHTVRAAYHILESRHLVSIRPRVGTVVGKYVPFPTTKKYVDTLEGLVGVLIPDMADFYQQVMEGISSILGPGNLIPVVIPCSEDPYFAEAIYRTISARGFAGVLNISIGFSDEYYQVLRSQNNMAAPLVFLDDVAAFGHRILLDTPGAVSTAVHHLAVIHGCRKISLINCPPDWDTGKEVLRGYRNGLEETEIEYSADLVYSVPDFTFEAGRFCGEKILANGESPDAVVAAGDMLALGAISAFKTGGVKVPDDIAVIGYNDIPVSSISDPPLTTIVLPSFQIGARGAEILLEVMNGMNKGWIEETFAGELVIRKSCGC